MTETPVSLQLFGSDPDVISEMAKRIEERPFSILDINMGCPVPKVTGNGEGSALMKNPKLVEEIITKTARAIRKPVTVKIRKGFDESHVNAVEIAKIAGSQWCGCCGSSRTDPGTVLQWQSGLGYYPSGERSGEDSCDRERRRDFSRERRCNHAGDWL